jgi:GAF domain-containing protein
VQKFPGHITCDAASRAEIVVPLLESGTLIGVLDVDSPRAGRFDEADARGLEALAALLVTARATRPAR